MNYLLVFFLFCSSVIYVQGLRCYACSKGEVDPDMRCISEPEKTQVVNCDKKYCVSVRQEYKDATHRVANMYRSCADQKMDDTIEDDTFKIYYRSCMTDLCNSGSGREDSNLGDNSNKQGFPGTIFTKGTGAGMLSAVVTPFLIVILVVLTTFF